jgi:hypothetical protein
MDEVMVVTGLVGALVASSYKWGYFVFAMVALFFIAYNVCWVGRIHANALGREIGRTYLSVAVWTIFLWFIYPIAWGLCEGANVISPDSEAVFYGILDILAKPVFGAILLFGHRNIDPRSLGLSIRELVVFTRSSPFFLTILTFSRYDEPIPLKEHGSGAGNGIGHNGVHNQSTAPTAGTDNAGTGAGEVGTHANDQHAV